MRSSKQDGGQCWDQWYETRKANLLKISGPLPKKLCNQELNLTSCCRYAETLVANPKVARYFRKHHAKELQHLLLIIAKHNEDSRSSDETVTVGLEAIRALKERLT